MTQIPKYSDLQLEVILNSVVDPPPNITQSVFDNRLKNNSKLHWRINPFLQREQKLSLILDLSKVRRWKMLRMLNWLIALLIVAISLIIKDYVLLWGLLIFPLFIASGELDSWIVFFNCAVIFAFKYFFGLHSSFFWFIFSISLLTYLLNKLTVQYVVRSIFGLAFNDINTFWKFYTNRLIYIDSTALNNEFQELVSLYPELQAVVNSVFNTRHKGRNLDKVGSSYFSLDTNYSLVASTF